MPGSYNKYVHNHFSDILKYICYLYKIPAVLTPNTFVFTSINLILYTNPRSTHIIKKCLNFSTRFTNKNQKVVDFLSLKLREP